MDRAVPSVREVFGRYSDSRWLKVLIRSIDEPVIKGVRLPGFAPPEVQSSTVGSANKGALKEAFRFYTYVKEACAAHSRPLGASSHILDFGVCWGRFIRFFMKDVDPEGLHGVDTSPEYLAIARETGVPGSLHHIEPVGALPFPDDSFDLVYAYSVFTHLPEHVQDCWLREIRRALKPGALFIATVEPPRFLDFFASLDPGDASLHPWHATMARKTQADPTLRARLAEHGFIYMPDDRPEVADVYGDSVMTAKYVREHWGEHFEIVEYVDDPQRFWQAVVVARKRRA